MTQTLYAHMNKREKKDSYIKKKRMVICETTVEKIRDVVENPYCDILHRHPTHFHHMDIWEINFSNFFSCQFEHKGWVI
jgi:hypothetical protein